MSEFQVHVREENAVAARRSQVYSAFARAFRYPSDEASTEHLRSGDAEEQLAQWLEQLGAISASERTHGARTEARVDVLHSELFDTALGRSAISLHERDHVRDGREVLWEDLFRFYTHFGLQFEDGGLDGAPDSLTIELEFMHYLAFLEASNSASARGVVLGQADFLARHVAAWVPVLCDALVERSPATVYSRLAILLRDFVAGDSVYVQSKARELRAARRAVATDENRELAGPPQSDQEATR